jgi:hypothetical protein
VTNAGRSGLPLALAIAFVASGALAAGPDDPESVFERGVADMEAGRYDRACPAIEHSYILDPRPGTLFALADCEAKRGHLAAAVGWYDAYLALYPTLPPDKRAKQGDREKLARAQRAALGAKVAELTLVLAPSAPKGTLVTRDGATVEQKALGVPVPVDPGEHVITVRAPGGNAVETRVTLAAGDRRGVALEANGKAEIVQAPATLSGSGQAPPAQGGANKGLIVAGAVVGGGGVLAGAVLLGLSASKASSASTVYAGIEPPAACPPPGSANLTGPCATLASDLSARATLGNAGFWLLVGGGVVGAATLVYGVVGNRAAQTAPATGVRVLPGMVGDGGGLLVSGAF